MSYFKIGRVECGCRCVGCGAADLESRRTGRTEKDGYFDRHHTCRLCGCHFDHLDGTVFERCVRCRHPA